MDPVEFLSQHEPFSRLSEPGRGRLGRSLEVSYVPRGSTIMSVSGPKNEFLWIVRKGSVELQRDGRSVDVLVEGECFGFPSLLAVTSPRFEVIAVDDCLLYKVPREDFEALLAEQGFRAFFLEGLADRLRRVTDPESVPLVGDLTTPVGVLSRREPVFVRCDATVGDAARTMREERVGSVLVRCEPMGIVTDRDLRARVLAEGLGPDTPVQSVMSSPLRSFPAAAPLYEALLYLLEQRIHHLPLVENRRVVGMVTHTDLLRHQVKSPGYLLKTIEKASDPQALAGYVEEITGMVESLLWSGLEPTHIGRLVATLNDALVQKLIRNAESELGSPPCEYAWLVFGSEGRREQTLITDQDNALVFEEATDGAGEYFAELAKRVVEGLIRASFPPCAGGFMATNWNKPLAEWIRLFGRWTSEPEPQALLEVANLFDFRSIHGSLELEPLHEQIAGGAESALFLGHLARASLGMRPPIGLFHRIKQKESGVDLKAAGLMPIVGLARVHALEAASRERSTLGRLDAARAAGKMSAEGADTLAEGFRFLFRLRLEGQLRKIRRGEEAHNSVRLERLTALERRHLKETFLHVRQMQQDMSQRFRVDMLG
jgi:CBS domain-containing protein